MANERKTENIVRELLSSLGYYTDSSLFVEEQKSDNPRINKLLQNASKKGNGKGYPEFIIHSSKYSELLIVIECKADIGKHESNERNLYADFAVDGVLLYSSFLSKEYDVISIAVSGENNSDFRFSQYLQLKSSSIANQFLSNKLIQFEEYHDEIKRSEYKFHQDYLLLLDYTKELNDLLHAQKIKESQRGLLISGILIALQNIAFKQSYSAHQKSNQIANSLLSTITDEFSNASLTSDKVQNLRQAYSFILTNTTLANDKDFFVSLISGVEKNVNNFIRTYKYFDTLGQFYIEFLRYANSDKGLGIVLTPPHITELFTEIANIDKDSIVFDNCIGTGGFLISAMKRMVKNAEGDNKKITEIKNKQLIGVEYQDDIYALGVSNMIIHGDGKTNIILGDCFQESSTVKINFNPTIGFLNPPYKSKKSDREELDFLLNNLSAIKKGGCCVAIVPFNCAVATSGEVLDRKKSLMEKHTIEAIMTMPEDLFHNSKVNVVTCIFVITAHIPHPLTKKTWFGYWRDDGFVKVKNRGRVDLYGKWISIKNQWLSSFHNKDNIPNQSIKRIVKCENEWCAEAYMETDYSRLCNVDWTKTIRKFVAHQFAYNIIDDVYKKPVNEAIVNIQSAKWKSFKVNNLFELSRGLSSGEVEISEFKDNETYIPYLRPSNNYSIYNGYVSNLDVNEKFIFPKFTLIMGNTGAGSHTYTYLIAEEFVPNNNLTVILPKRLLNIFHKLFIINIIEHNRYRYNYGRIPSNERFLDSYLSFPVKEDGHVDWDYIEKFMKTLPYSSSIEKF